MAHNNAKTWQTRVFYTFAVMVVISLGLASRTIPGLFPALFGQLIQVPWLQSIRATTIGHLILGSGFNPLDLAAYSIGALFGAILHKLLELQKQLT